MRFLRSARSLKVAHPTFEATRMPLPFVRSRLQPCQKNALLALPIARFLRLPSSPTPLGLRVRFPERIAQILVPRYSARMPTPNHQPTIISMALIASALATLLHEGLGHGVTAWLRGDIPTELTSNHLSSL